MKFEDNETNPSDSAYNHFQLSSYIDRFIRLKTTYWNRQYAIILLAYTGFIITSYQYLFHLLYFSILADQNKVNTVILNHYLYFRNFHRPNVNYLFNCSHEYIDALTHIFLQFCMGITKAGVLVANFRVWTYWVPLNTQSIRHVPIILSYMLHENNYIYGDINTLLHPSSYYTLRLTIGVIGLAWYVLWLYVINDNQFRSLNRNIILFGGSNNSRYPLGKSEVSLTRSIVSDIPWKSLFTSVPILVIVFLFLCKSGIHYYQKADGGFYTDAIFVQQTRTFTIILLILIVILVELAPEIIVSISTTKIRKFWSCLFLGSMIIYFILKAIIGNTLKTNKIYHFILLELQHLRYFGYCLCYLDFAPNYASLTFSFLKLISYFFNILWETVLSKILIFKILNNTETKIFMAVMCLTMAMV